MRPVLCRLPYSTTVLTGIILADPSGGLWPEAVGLGACKKKSGITTDAALLWMMLCCWWWRPLPRRQIGEVLGWVKGGDSAALQLRASWGSDRIKCLGSGEDGNRHLSPQRTDSHRQQNHLSHQICLKKTSVPCSLESSEKKICQSIRCPWSIQKASAPRRVGGTCFFLLWPRKFLSLGSRKAGSRSGPCLKVYFPHWL